MYNKKSNIQISPSFLTLPAFYQFVCYTDLKKQCARQFSPRKQWRLFALASSSILLLCIRRSLSDTPKTTQKLCPSVSLYNKKEKAKVVTAVWGTELIHFLTALNIFHQDDFKEKDEQNICTVVGYLAKCMLSKKVMIVRSHHTKKLPPYQNGCSPRNFCSKHP